MSSCSVGVNDRGPHSRMAGANQASPRVFVDQKIVDQSTGNFNALQ